MTPAHPNPPMLPENTCPHCGAPLAAGALAGLCPACLLQQGAMTGSGAGAETRPFEPPTVAELTPLFPQLEILELIGRGGMGAVYKARQKELDRVVALKILPPEICAAPGFAERFAQEARALAKLNHPGIVTIHDFGRAGALFYFLMEFVDGVNLRQLLAGGRIAPREALAIVPEICDALQFAHDHGIVHRDIKPENLLLDRRGRVKVADFGIAKMLHAEMPEAGLGETQPAGTPQYMAPEQKERGRADHRADIYSLGVVFYELLTGELPAEQLQPPSRKVQMDVRLDEIVMRALHGQPERRYRTVLDLKTQVEAVAATPSPSVVPPDSPRADSSTSSAGAARSPRRGRGWLIGAGLILLLGVISLAPTLTAPRQYFAKVIMEVKMGGDDRIVDPGSRRILSDTPRYDPQFVATQFQILQKTEILHPVVERLELVREFSPPGQRLPLQQVYFRLKKSMQLKEVRNTGLIEIGIYDTDPQRAANIANTIAVVFQEKRRLDISRSVERGLAPLVDEVEQQRKNVEQAAAQMAEVRSRAGIADPDPDSASSAISSATPGDKEAERRYIDAKSRYLQGRRSLGAAETALTQQRMNEIMTGDHDPVRIWERAERPNVTARRSLFDYFRR